MKTKRTARGRSRKKNRLNRVTMISGLIFTLCLGYFLVAKLVLQSYSNSLAVQNQTLTNEIEQRSTAIDALKSEITELQEKGRVLGMLEGQVYDNKNNVYYYGD
ncbi:hypothetical protein [Allobaculum mucilyticum]|uniref:hypothetical protein n=1 Tax=Allobaculum mucilyticum TaxID=2834459 RepID=UPI001E621F27|nr:hypothetical protein [Allobaculum mucilyticum]UNT97039.1 hypothetical protein KWG62_04625 [Allobaculum mucilyticum]